jgi:hypothetical protein
MTLDLNKPMQTRDGKPARFLGTINNESEYIFAIMDEDGSEYVVFRYASGKVEEYGRNSGDIINAPEALTTYQRIYANVASASTWTGTSYDSLEAIGARDHTRSVGILKLTLENGKPVKAELV